MLLAYNLGIDATLATTNGEFARTNIRVRRILRTLR